jgi:hypothetical protein
MTARPSLSAVLAALALSACTTNMDDPRFGDAVRHMIRVQTYQPGDEVPPLDAAKAAAAVNAYRQDLGDREAIGGDFMQIEGEQ